MTYYVFLLEKPPRIDGEFIKSGFHLHFPIFNRRGLIISNLYPKITEKIDECKLFPDFGGSEVLDKGMPKKDPIIYGGHKKEENIGYTLTKFSIQNSRKYLLKKHFKIMNSTTVINN